MIRAINHFSRIMSSYVSKLNLNVNNSKENDEAEKFMHYTIGNINEVER